MEWVSRRSIPACAGETPMRGEPPAALATERVAKTVACEIGEVTINGPAHYSCGDPETADSRHRRMGFSEAPISRMLPRRWAGRPLSRGATGRYGRAACWPPDTTAVCVSSITPVARSRIPILIADSKSGLSSGRSSLKIPAVQQSVDFHAVGFSKDARGCI